MKNVELSLYIIAFLSTPFVVMIWQALLNRLFPTKGAQSLTMLAMVLGYPLYFALVYALPFSEHTEFSFILYHFLIYSFSAYTYFHVFNMSQTSRRIRLLHSIGSGSSTQRIDVENLFDAKQMFQIRLDRLVALGQIEERNGRYYSTGTLFYMTSKFIYGLGVFVNRPWPELKSFKKEIE